MKWLNRILGKEEIPTTVTFDGIDDWLDIASKSLFRGLSANADKLYEEIRDIRERLEQNAVELQDAEPKEDISATIVKIGLPNRDKMVKHLYSLTEKMLIPTKTDYKTVLSFYQATMSNMKLAFGKSSKNVYYVRSLFPDEVKEITSNLNRLRKLLDQLVAPMKGKESQIMHLEQVPKILQEIKDLILAIERKEEKVRGQEEEYSALEKEVGREKERLRTVEAQEEWMRFKELDNELSSSEEELNTLESNVRKSFAPIEKELSLLKKQDETGRHTLTAEERKAITLILSSPIRALDEDINRFLLTIRDLIEGDSSILKHRKREKTLKWIDHLLNNAELPAVKEKRNRLESRIEEVKSEISGLRILKDRKEIEDSITSTKEQLTRTRERINRSKRNIASLKEEVTEKKQLLIEDLEAIAGKKIEVDFGMEL